MRPRTSKWKEVGRFGIRIASRSRFEIPQPFIDGRGTYGATIELLASEFSNIKAVARGKIMNLPMEPKTLGLLVATLFFLLSLLINLLQRRYTKTRLGRMLRKEESVVNFLEEIHRNLGKIEVTCTLEVQGASSPQEVGKTIHLVRNEIQSTVGNLQEHLRSFGQHRRKGKARGKPKRALKTGSRG